MLVIHVLCCAKKLALMLVVSICRRLSFFSRLCSFFFFSVAVAIKRVTTDHKPSLPAEEARIKAAGGFVTRTQTKRGEVWFFFVY
jgi:hypothetical protein